jgi:hypothetical protein
MPKVNDHARIDGYVKFKLEDTVTGEITELGPFHNLTPSTALNYFVSVLCNLSQQNNPWYAALGASTAAVSSTQAKLISEGERKLVGSKSVLTGNTIDARTVFQPSEGVGTWYEAGLFAEGTTGKDAGTLLSRVLVPAGLIKSALQILTIDQDIVFSSTST